MASLGEFESTLKEVVKAKRVSASKMAVLTELALKSMNDDTQLVSIMYRTHKSLPTSAKVSSLYTFDALARAARSKVTKHNLTGDINTEKGNCATFLLKIEGVLDGLFQDMTKSGIPEGKEKSKKILDIWTKANTFPSTVLARLRDLVKDDEKESDKVVTTAITDPRTAHQSPPAPTATAPAPPPIPQTPTTQPPISTAIDPAQSALLALLNQAANAGGLPNSQTPTNTIGGFPASQPQIDPVHLALLQQLAQTNKLGNGVPGHQQSPVTLQPSIPNGRPTSAGGFGGPSQPHPPYRDDRYGSGRGDPRYGRYDNPGRGRGRDGGFNEEQGEYRGNHRGGFRGRGRGFDDRDNFRDREGYRSPPLRPRRSRSKSPPGRFTGGRRDVKPYSPPHRPTTGNSSAPVPMPRLQSHTNATPTQPIAAAAGKDEFGRDIRPQSPDEAPTDKDAQPLSPPVESSVPAAAIVGSQMLSVSNQTPPAAATNTSAQTNSTPAAESPRPGLDQFDMSTFNFTDPTAWDTLGKMWQITYGYMPTTEQLMQFVMSSGAVATVAAAGLIPGQFQAGMDVGGMGMNGMGNMGMGMEQSWAQSDGQWGGHIGGGRGGHPSRGGGSGYGRGNTRNGQSHMGGYGNSQSTDAIVLGGGENDDDAMQMQSPPTGQSSPPSGDGGPGGRMQRVGDKWVFVRDTATS